MHFECGVQRELIQLKFGTHILGYVAHFVDGCVDVRVDIKQMIKG